MKLQSELQRALDVLIYEHENVEMPSQSNVKSIMTYGEEGKSRIFKSKLVSQSNGNPTLSKARIIYMKPKILTVVNYDNSWL